MATATADKPPAPGAMYSRAQRYRQLMKQLEGERNTWDPQWRDISDYVLAERSRFLVEDTNKGDSSTAKIIDSTATESNDVLAAGIATSVTSPAMPWFGLDVPDRHLATASAGRRWLDDTAQDMRDVMAGTNLYLALHTLYGDLAAFGTSTIAVEEDIEKVLRCTVHPIGSYYLACNHKNIVDTWARKLRKTVRQVVTEFGYRRCSLMVRQAWDNNQLSAPVEIYHLIMPNEAMQSGSPLSKHKPFLSCYFEAAAPQSGYDEDSDFLAEEGFDEFPIMAPRWDAKAEDVYGKGPGKRSLPDVKQLQVMQKELALSIALMNRPPMVANPMLKTGDRPALFPAGITWADERDGRLAFRPAMEAMPQIEPMIAAIQDVRARVRRAHHADLFLMHTLDARSQPPTAEEIRARENEKLLQLGPVYNRLSDELYDPLIARVFGIMLRRRMIRPPPPELQGQPLKIRYTNVLAQAQRQVGLGSIDRTIGFAVANAAVFPRMLDGINEDEALLAVADKTGLPSKILRTPEEREAIRQGRAKQQAAQEQTALAEQQANTAKTLAETPTTGDTALSALSRVMASRPSAEA